MSYGIRKDFYHSKVWKSVRKNIWLRQNLLCSICHKPVYVDGISSYLPKEKRRTGIVHHIIHLDNTNVYDNNITINEANLIGVCKDCHEKLHNTVPSIRDNYLFDEEGNIKKKINTPPI